MQPSTAALHGFKLKWKRNADVSAPLIELTVDEPKVKITFAPHKLRSWKIVVGDKQPVFFSGTRVDQARMQHAAEAMVEQLEKEAA